MYSFSNKNQPSLSLSLSNIFHRADVIEFQLSGSENTVLYIENLYGRVKTEAYEILPFLDNRLLYLLFNFFDLLSYFYFVLFRDFSMTRMRTGVQYRSSYAPKYTQLTLQQLRNRIFSSLLQKREQIS